MAITNGYSTLAEILWRLGGALSGWAVGDDATRDAVMEQQVQAVSRVLDSLTGHKFHATDETWRWRYRGNADTTRRTTPDHRRKAATFSEPFGAEC